MSYLISVNSKGTAVLFPECIKLCPELAYLNEKELLAIVLAVDYHSPYRQHSRQEAERRAKAHVFGSENPDFFKQPKILKAIDFYKSLQYDEIREQIKAYRRRLDAVTRVIDGIAEDDVKKLKDVMSVSTSLRAEIRKIEEELIKQEEAEASEFDKKLSFLERLQKNVVRYREVTKKKDASK